MISDGKVGWLRCMVLCGFLALCYATSATAQRTTANLRGKVTDQSGAPLPAAAVTATNTQTGFKRTALANGEGVYILAGLQPGTYDVSIQAISYAPQTRRITVLIGQDLNGDFQMSVQAIEIAGITATATRPVETRTSEVATNITRQEIENLPVPDRNFLALGTLAPGMKSPAPNADGYVQPSAGALPAANINVFIDGASLKSDVLPSGVAGQDASKGNPFPQSAVQEFRVITQNFKAEYQKASSAIITAVTRSGGNQWEASGFVYGQPSSFVKPNSFQVKACQPAIDAGRACDPIADYKRYQAGAALGGPIIPDRMNFFASWEGNYQDRTAVVFPGKVPAGAVGLTQAEVDAQAGPHTAPFRENLFFGKVSYLATPNSTLELSANLRRENEDRYFGGISAGPQVSFESAEHFVNKTDMAMLRHQYTHGSWLNQAQINYQRFAWNPTALDFNNPSRVYNGVITLGGRDTRQDFTQRRIEMRNDVTYSGLENHAIKGGAYVGFLNYHVVKELTGNPIYTYNFDLANGVNFDVPTEVRIGFGDPDLSTDNKQIGLYLQDDWNVTERLQFNLGVRWDVETDMNNRDYVTPANYVTKFANLLPAEYFSTGSNRKPFYGAIQPRFGFSYDLEGEGKTVLFGGAGIYYDRDVYNDFLDERFRPQWRTYTLHFNRTGPTPNCGDCIQWQSSYGTRAGLQTLLQGANPPSPEQWFLSSDLRPPKSYQFSGGLRHTFGNVLASATYTGNRGYNGVTYIWGHREVNPQDPGAKPPTGNCCQWGTYGPVIVSDAHVRSWYDALQLQLQKPLLATNRWGGSVAVSFGRAEKNGGDLFTFDFPRVDMSPRHATDRDQRYEVNLFGVWRAPFDILASTITQLGSGYPYVSTDCTAGWDKCKFFGTVLRPEKKSFIVPDAFAYRRVDFRLQKDVILPQGNRVSVLGEVWNAFNFANEGCYEAFIPAGGVVPGSDYGKARCGEPARRYQLGLSFGMNK